LFLLLALSLPGHATCTKATASSASTLTVLGIHNLAAAAVMVASFGGLALYRMGLSTLAQTLMVSASRCAIQVFVLGSVVLQHLLGTTHPWLVGFWIASVGLIAAKEAFSRVQYTYHHMRRHVYVSVLTGALSVLATALLLSVFGRLSPWYQPRTLIPLAGMLFGNTLTAAALAASGITRQFATQQEMVEWRLVRGATAQEAILPLVQETMSTALTPTLNGLAVTGIVHIPGMMTGQILAGQSPPQAAAYQIMCHCAIACPLCYIEFGGPYESSTLWGSINFQRTSKDPANLVQHFQIE
jgi:putative ABC transport system permease protein